MIAIQRMLRTLRPICHLVGIKYARAVSSLHQHPLPSWLFCACFSKGSGGMGPRPVFDGNNLTMSCRRVVTGKYGVNPSVPQPYVCFLSTSLDSFDCSGRFWPAIRSTCRLRRLLPRPKLNKVWKSVLLVELRCGARYLQKPSEVDLCGLMRSLQMFCVLH